MHPNQQGASHKKCKTCDKVVPMNHECQAGWSDEVEQMREIVAQMIADKAALQVGEFGSYVVRGVDGDALYNAGSIGHRKY